MTRQRLRTWLHSCPAFFDERAQDAFEYLLVTGVVAVALAVALVIGFEALVPTVVNHSCPSIDTSNASGGVSANGACITSH